MVRTTEPAGAQLLVQMSYARRPSKELTIVAVMLILQWGHATFTPETASLQAWCLKRTLTITMFSPRVT